MGDNSIKKAYIILLTFTFIWCCEIDYIKINNDCYYKKDIEFLKILINNSQFGSNPPPLDLSPLDLGWQSWQDGRLIEFCCSTSTNTECRMNYSLSGDLPPEIGNLTELQVISLESNSLNGNLPSEIGKLLKLQELLH